jgi:anti-sigma-K factor RskA
MLLNGVPSNDPQTAQYQLWIVDPSRDPDSPVDGGVFNIPTDGSPAIIPIDAKLAIKQPQVFVITLEQPGGVVKSKQETVVAIAKL